MVVTNNVNNTKKEIILVLDFKKSVIKKNKVIPKKALIVFALSPVIKIPIKLINMINKRKNLKLFLLFLYISIK